MIAYLEGQVLSKHEKNLILKCGGVGYLVYTTTSILSTIQNQDEIQLFIHNHIREDCLDLYGFQDEKQLNFFKQLISINGIGPKVALEILNFELEKVKLAIINDDVAFITKIPGIGKKTAQRMIIDLKNKIEMENLESDYNHTTTPEVENEVLTALTGLGYNRKHIKLKLQEIPAELKKAEDIITYILKNN